jgi:hypothetical protein
MKSKPLPENERPLAKAAFHWLMKERVHASPWSLHVPDWGLENKVDGEWPDRDRPAVELQVGLLQIVTMTGNLMRGRHTTAILEMMGVRETTAKTIDEYASIAVGLTQNPRARMAHRPRSRTNKHRLYRDRGCIWPWKSSSISSHDARPPRHEDNDRYQCREPEIRTADAGQGGSADSRSLTCLLITDFVFRRVAV